MLNLVDLYSLNHLIIDVQETWPKDLLNVLNDSKEILLNFLEEENKIDNEAIENIMFRINRPENKFQQEWDSTVVSIGKIISKSKFMGFHATRLLKVEQDEILDSGLRPLNSELLEFKLKILLDQGLISLDEYSENMRNSQVGSLGRENHIFTFHELRTLGDESGLVRLFRCWGGEFFYYSKEDRKEFRDKFFNIGKATILLTSHKYEDVQRHNVERRMIKNFLNPSRDQGRNDFDNCHSKPLTVIGYIDEDCKLFYELTSYDKWRILNG
ncbi:MAG TPA: hypothetical protein DIW31_07680 [Bacteroidales bacterium]|nr:hypothetical protein [Bacteroidales bacterium]